MSGSRSPMAEAVLRHQITQRTSLQGKLDVRVDSAGTGAYHAGDDADERTIETCRRVSTTWCRPGMENMS